MPPSPGRGVERLLEERDSELEKLRQRTSFTQECPHRAAAARRGAPAPSPIFADVSILRVDVSLIVRRFVRQCFRSHFGSRTFWLKHSQHHTKDLHTNPYSFAPHTFS